MGGVCARVRRGGGVFGFLPWFRGIRCVWIGLGSFGLDIAGGGRYV